MEISNNRIKVTSMKTFAKFFLHFSLVMLSCLTTGCTSEVETIGATPEIPENPQANDPNRRSVVISLQNKLILVNGTPESRAITRDGIAEEDENRIESFDIYAFGSDKEEGPYTFQERFGRGRRENKCGILPPQRFIHQVLLRSQSNRNE